MATFHVNGQGLPAACPARRYCRFGPASLHFPTEEEARAAYEQDPTAFPSVKRYGLNDEAWERVLEESTVLDSVARQGFAVITASEFKRLAQREPRLAFNFTNSASLPKPLARHHLNILPLTRGSYLLAPYRAYYDFTQGSFTRHPLEHVARPTVKAIDVDNIPNEVQAIKVAYSTGMLHRVLGEEKLFPVLSGRMGGGTLDYQVDLLQGKTLPVHSANPQIEVDEGYEGEHCVAVIEAKKNDPQDFLIRQLYLPYRAVKAELAKKGLSTRVEPIFFNYVQGRFDFYRCYFPREDNLSSLEVKESFSFAFA